MEIVARISTIEPTAYRNMIEELVILGFVKSSTINCAASEKIIFRLHEKT